MEKDLISRSALIRALERCFSDTYGGDRQYWPSSACNALHIAYVIKAVEPEPVRREDEGWTQMYESPINIYMTQMADSYRMQRDAALMNEVYKAVERIGVDVDKDELLRALAYDRNQYRRGYRYGIEAAKPKWISVEERLPETGTKCLIFTKIHFIPDHVDECNYFFGIEISGFDSKVGFTSENGLFAKFWMPLPEPPKEEEHGQT